MLGDETGGQLLDEPGSRVADRPLAGLVRLLLAECAPDGLVTLLACEAGDLRPAALVCLGLTGDMRHCRAVARFLRHPDADVAQLAENSLWHIWMRSGSRRGNARLGRAIGLMRGSRYGGAARVLDRLCAAEPGFAEAHHQRGIALYFLERLEDASRAFRQALRLNRYHFSAAVNLGHTFAERCDLRGALRHYRYALRLHPRLDGIAEVVARLEALLGSRPAWD